MDSPMESSALPRVDVTVIGGGPCGLFAAFYAGLRGMTVRIVDSLPELGGQLTALYPEKYVYDMPGFPKVLAKDLARDLVAQGTQFGPDLQLDETADALADDEEGFALTTKSGKTLPTRTVIVAAGAGAFSPTKLGVPREDELFGKGVSYGVRRIADYQDKDVVVVGGGDSAFDWVMMLLPVAKSVTLVHRRDGFRAHDESVRQVQNSPCAMRLFRAVETLHGDERLERITIKDLQGGRDEEPLREDLPCDALVITVGFKSSLGAIKDWDLEIQKNQVVVDERFETRRPGVFAIGDVCTFGSKLKLIATGVGEAATAVGFAKLKLDPSAKLFPGHSSDREL